MTKRIFVAGHNGMVGRAIVRKLTEDSNNEIITRNRNELDLLSQSDVNRFFSDTGIDQVYLAAAKVGGIHANDTYPAQFIYENLMIETNIIHSAYTSGVQNLLFLGSSCIYPKFAEQPMREDALLTGVLEPTNEPYAIAKIAGIKLCESYNRQYGTNYRSVMPTNLYGSFDNFHPENSHVVPALLARFHEAVEKESEVIVIWGSGKPKREFLHVDDMASACLHVANLSNAKYDEITEPMLSHINVGTGIDCTISELAHTIAKVTGFKGKMTFDTSKPDGTQRKLLDTSKLNASGWQPEISLFDGLKSTYDWFLGNQENLRGKS